MGLAVPAPRFVAAAIFGDSDPSASTLLLVRHWGLLVALVGALLIYAAWHPEVRVPVMIVAAIEKFAIGALVLTSPLRARHVTLAVVGADAIMALLFVALLIGG